MPKGIYKRMSPEKRFLTKVNKNGPVHPILKTRCWLWLGSVTPDGYGQFQIIGEFRAHRVAYKLFVEEISEGLLILHRCDNPICVRPDHLKPGTHQDNMNDMVERGRGALGDKNGTRKRPETLFRGQEHWTFKSPELIARGDASGRILHPESYPVGDEHYARTNPEKLARGEVHGMAKLSEDDAREIKRRYRRGNRWHENPNSAKSLAAEFGVAQGTIMAIVRGKSWKHLG